MCPSANQRPLRVYHLAREHGLAPVELVAQLRMGGFKVQGPFHEISADRLADVDEAMRKGAIAQVEAEAAAAAAAAKAAAAAAAEAAAAEAAAAEAAAAEAAAEAAAVEELIPVFSAPHRASAQPPRPRHKKLPGLNGKAPRTKPATPRSSPYQSSLPVEAAPVSSAPAPRAVPDEAQQAVPSFKAAPRAEPLGSGLGEAAPGAGTREPVQGSLDAIRAQGMSSPDPSRPRPGGLPQEAILAGSGTWLWIVGILGLIASLIYWWPTQG